jgi:N-acetylmuramoyl-L-alanine amidase
MLGLLLGAAFPANAAAQSAQAQYAEAKTRDDAVRVDIAATAPTAPTPARTKVITEARAIISSYERLVRQFRASGYSDNALFNAATLAEALHTQYALTTDLDSALRLYKRLKSEYPTAPLATEAGAALTRLSATAAASKPAATAPTFAPDGATAGKPMTPTAGKPVAADATTAGKPIASASARTETPASAGETSPKRPDGREGGPVTPGGARARLTGIERTVMTDLVRVTLALDREVSYYEETLAGPARVFFDFKNVEAAAPLVDAVLRFPSDVVRLIRVGRHPNAIRVVLDLEGVKRHSVYTLYNPYRVVIDAEAAVTTAAAAPRQPTVALAESRVVPSVVTEPALAPDSATAGKLVAPFAPAPVVPVAPSTPVAPVPVAPRAPVAPVAPNLTGGFSIARQLGLGVARVVIDPGHGGHDPGAQAKGLNEADLTLDIALRLEKLLVQEPGLEVVLTRRSDVYIPLEERTAIANREGADLFLSIHANTSRATTARGIETYFLSFAGSADAEAVAARENASHGGEMHKLPDIIKAITLNNKLDESRDLAGMVQEALVTRLRRSNSGVLNRGVKKAPFVVLIGAEMPSVLAEVSFLTNKQELQLLKTSAYKQRIADALHAAVMRYRRSLKGAAAIAAQ